MAIETINLNNHKNDSSEISLKYKSLLGFTWLFSHTVITRLINFCGQIILAWLLEPNIFGLIGLAYSVNAFATLVQDNGINNILVARQAELDKLVNPSFWYCLATGMIAACLLIVAAPFAASHFNSPELKGLIYVMAAAAPLNAVAVIPRALLYSQLRFRAIAVIETVSLTGQMILTVIFAACGFGAYSFVIPILIVSTAVTGILYSLTNPGIRLMPEIKQWRELITQSGLLFFTAVCNRAIQYGDYLIVGTMFSTESVGIYYFAFNLSMQTMTLLSANMTNTLFPVLSKMQNEPGRQKAAFIRTARILALVGIPVSFFISVNADPFIRLLFSDKWLPAISILQILALGMGIRSLEALSGAYLRSQSRFRELAIFVLMRSFLFFAFALTGAKFGLTVFAVAVTVTFIVSPVLCFFFALGFTWDNSKIFIQMNVLPLSFSVVSAFLCIGTGSVISVYGSYLNILMILFSTAIFSLFSFISVRCFAPVIWNELMIFKRNKLFNPSSPK